MTCDRASEGVLDVSPRGEASMWDLVPRIE